MMVASKLHCYYCNLTYIDDSKIPCVYYNKPVWVLYYCDNYYAGIEAQMMS